MYTGWLTKFKVDRPLDAVERLERLPRERVEECSERHCVISLNSTYMDVIDRRYRLRGMVGTTVATLVCSAMALFGLWMLFFWVPTARPDGVYDWRVAAVFLLIFVGQWPLVCWLTFGRDFFFVQVLSNQVQSAYADGACLRWKGRRGGDQRSMG